MKCIFDALIFFVSQLLCVHVLVRELVRDSIREAVRGRLHQLRPLLAHHLLGRACRSEYAGHHLHAKGLTRKQTALSSIQSFLIIINFSYTQIDQYAKNIKQ